MKSDQLAKVRTIKITGNMSGNGYGNANGAVCKNPNKIKVIYNFNGKEMVSVFDGEKGYMVNPMTGSSNPVELTGRTAEADSEK